MIFSFLKRAVFVFLAASVLAAAASSQTSSFSDAASARKKNANPKLAVPFVPGEKLLYEGKLDIGILPAVSVAELNFSVGETPVDTPFQINAEARSKGTIIKLFGFSFFMQVDSTITRDDFYALKTVKHDVQKERVRDSETIFDYKTDRVTFTETNPKEPMKPPRTIASQLEGETHDLISAIYMLRLLPFEVGKTFELSVSDSGLVYRVPVRVTGREKKKTIFGKVWCYRVEPGVFGEGNLIERPGSMVIWVTDDSRRLPVRALVKANVGKVDIKLKKITNPPKPKT